jgi:hypothetical protein
LVGEDPSLTLTLQSSTTRGGRQAIYAAIDTLLLEDIMETGLTLEYLRQTSRSARGWMDNLTEG